MIKPVNNNILLLEIDVSVKTNGGLLIKNFETNIKKAKVVQIADDVDLVKEGDIVLIFVNDTEKIMYNGEQYLIVKQDKIQAIVEE